MKKVSFLIPVLNEELNIEPLYNEITSILEKKLPQIDYEIIFTDNNSSDDSYRVIKELNLKNHKVKCYSFQKNYGKEKSIFFAYKKCNGDAAIQLDCDFQDSPSLIPNFIENWLNGYDIVYGKRTKRKEGIFYRSMRSFFYRFLKLISKNNLEIDVGDFGLVSRKVINEILKHDQENIFLRGLIASFNFKNISIEYKRPERRSGKSTFSLLSYLSTTINAITFQTTSPLRYLSVISLIISFISLLGILYYFITKLIYPDNSPAGFATQTILIILVLCFNSLFLSVVGEYISKMYEELIKKEEIIIKNQII